MGCSESSEFNYDEIAGDVYYYATKKQYVKCDEVLHAILWHDNRHPDWEMAKKVVTTNIATTSHEWKETILHYAVRLNDLELLAKILNYDPPLDVSNSHGNSVLHTCCVVGCSAETFKLLVKDQIQNDLVRCLHQTNEQGDMPLHLATRNQFGWLVEAILQCGADAVRTNGEGDTPLDIVELALKRNPLTTRGHVTRMKTMKDWWKASEMEYAYIRQLLVKGIAGGFANGNDISVQSIDGSSPTAASGKRPPTHPAATSLSLSSGHHRMAEHDSSTLPSMAGLPPSILVTKAGSHSSEHNDNTPHGVSYNTRDGVSCGGGGGRDRFGQTPPDAQLMGIVT